MLSHTATTSGRILRYEERESRNVEDCVTDDNGADDTNGGKTITWSDIVQKDREGLSFSRNNPID